MKSIKINKLGITLIFVVALLLFVPAIAFAEGEDVAATDPVTVDNDPVVTTVIEDPVVPADSSGSGGNSYTAEITPDSGLGISEPTDFTVTFTEKSDNTNLVYAQLTIPDELTSISPDLTITASDSKIWFGGLVGQVISMWADTPADYLGQNDWVSVVFTATTPSVPGNYTFETLSWTDSVGSNDELEPEGTPKKVELGTAESFAVLAGSGITVAGAVDTTIIYGDIGSEPTGTFTGEVNVVQTGGDVYLADAGGVAAGAQDDLTTAYLYAAGVTSTRNITDLDLGNLSTLANPLLPGVYTASSSLGLTGTLYLYADSPYDAFIFQIGSTLTTASYSNIVLLGEATFCQVFWQVGSSATLGTYSTFVGHIMALTDITANTGATVIGQLLARNGAVELDNNTITNRPCSTVNAPYEDYDETLVVTVGTDYGTDTGTDYTIPGATLLETESVLGAGTGTQVLSGALELPSTGGFPIAEALSAMGMALMAIGGVILKKKLV